MSEKLGIQNLKVAIIATINLAENIEKKQADDGKISLSEAIGVGAGAFVDVVKVLKSGKQIKEEFLDLDAAEKDELLLIVQDELDLENDKIEAIIEKSIEFLMSLEDLISTIKK